MKDSHLVICDPSRIHEGVRHPEPLENKKKKDNKEERIAGDFQVIPQLVRMDITEKTRYLFEVKFCIVIDADSEDDAFEKAVGLEDIGWGAVLDDVKVRTSSVIPKGLDESEGERKGGSE